MDQEQISVNNPCESSNYFGYDFFSIIFLISYYFFQIYQTIKPCEMVLHSHGLYLPLWIINIIQCKGLFLENHISFIRFPPSFSSPIQCIMGETKISKQI